MGVLRTLNLLAFLPLAPRVPTYSKLLISLARDERVPASRKALLAVAGAYVLSPIDFVPDWMPLVGGLDDVLVVVLAVEAFLAGLPPKLVDEKLDELGIPRSGAGGGHAPRAAGGAQLRACDRRAQSRTQSTAFSNSLTGVTFRPGAPADTDGG